VLPPSAQLNQDFNAQKVEGSVIKVGKDGKPLNDA